MLDYEVHELVAVDQTEILAGTPEMYGVLGVGAECDEQPEL